MDYNKEQEKKLKRLEKEITKTYTEAYKQISIEATKYFEKYKKRWEMENLAYLTTTLEKDEIQQRYLNLTGNNKNDFEKWYWSVFQAYGETPAEAKRNFQAWELTQLGRGEGWKKLQSDMAERVTNANKTASAYINDASAGIYSLSYDYSAYEISQAYKGISFQIYDEQTVKNMIKNGELKIMKTRIDIPKDLAWNKKALNKALLSGILQGHSIDKLANAFQQVTNMNEASAMRNARTMYTSVQNEGRQDTYSAYENYYGEKLKKEWISAHDSRTRDSHAELDGEVVDSDKEFSNGLMFPADTSGKPSEVYNCRCTMRAVLPYIKYQKRETYEEWAKRQKQE